MELLVGISNFKYSQVVERPENQIHTNDIYAITDNGDNTIIYA